MGWFLSFASAVIAAIAGCVLAYFIADQCVSWYRVSSFEGGSGYYVVFLSLFGLAGSFVIGFAVAKTFGSGFLQGTGLALGAVFAVMGSIYLLARMGGDVPPEIDGDSLELMVEMRMAPDWKPSNLALAGENACTLTSLGGSARRRPRYGDIDFKQAARRDGHWVVPCQVSLHSMRSPLLLGMRLGKKTDVEFVSPLPSQPEPKHEQWSDWSSTGFAQPVGQPPVAGYSYRVRVKRHTVAAGEKRAAEVAKQEQSRRDFAALTESSPLKSWLPFATDPRNNADGGKAQQVLGTRLNEMGEPLKDDDVTVVLQALEFLRRPDAIPVELHAPVLAAGRRVLPLIAKAREAADPQDPDELTEKMARNFGHVWKQVAEKTGAPMDAVKAEIREAASYAKAGEIYELAESMR